MAILSAMTADELRFAILAEDAKAIAKAPGIGPKTAKRMIIELKDKLNLESMIEGHGDAEMVIRRLFVRCVLFQGQMRWTVRRF